MNARYSRYFTTKAVLNNYNNTEKIENIKEKLRQLAMESILWEIIDYKKYLPEIFTSKGQIL